MTIRLLIVDDHEVMRQSIAKFLSNAPDVEVIGDTGLSEEVLAICRSGSPDVILLDVRMKDMSGIELTRRIRATGSIVGIVGLSMYQGEGIRDQMINAGADAYVDKMAPLPELVSLVRKSAAAAAKRAADALNGGVNQH